MPGVESVEVIAPDVYKGILGVKIGPIGVRLEGQVTLVEQNRDDWMARMDIEATDRKIRGAVNAKAWMKLTPREDGQTDLAIHTDASIFGKLGQFGQAVMKKKADQVVREFADNMARKLVGARRRWRSRPTPRQPSRIPRSPKAAGPRPDEIEVPEKVS